VPAIRNEGDLKRLRVRRFVRPQEKRLMFSEVCVATLGQKGGRVNAAVLRKSSIRNYFLRKSDHQQRRKRKGGTIYGRPQKQTAKTASRGEKLQYALQIAIIAITRCQNGYV